LDLLAGRVLDLDRHRPAAAVVLADQAHGSQLLPAQLADQRRVGALEPGVDELAVQHGGVEVRVIAKARRDVRAKRLQAARRRPAVLAGALAAQVPADRLGITSGVAADGSNRPAPRPERVDLHVILLSEHPRWALLQSVA
jgi:hypothetical protein